MTNVVTTTWKRLQEEERYCYWSLVLRTPEGESTEVSIDHTPSVEPGDFVKVGDTTFLITDAACPWCWY